MKLETIEPNSDANRLSCVKVVTGLRILICLLAIFKFCVPSNAQELQRSQEFQVEVQDWVRGADAVPAPGIDRVVVANLDDPELQLKWAIVSGGLNESVDRVRARILLNKESWIILHYKKNAYGSYEQSVTNVHTKKSVESEDPKTGIETSIADLRIVEWDHDKLIVKFQRKEELPRYFRFDLSRNPNP